MNKRIKNTYTAKMTTDGAGVQLDRLFGYSETPNFDPFLLLDYFETHDPKAVSMGFPWHPHRGIETISYVISGEIDHEDSLGNKGTIRDGDVQWMTAGSGIIHQEMPKVTSNGLQGFQLWLNLSAKDKMIKPKYNQILSKDIPIINTPDYSLKIIAGSAKGQSGPIKKSDLNILLLDLILQPEKSVEIETSQKEAFIFLYEGEIIIEGESVLSLNVVTLTEGNKILIRANNRSKMLIGAGMPLNEPIAWGGPIVMNTKEELNTAYVELDEGTFIKE